MKQKALLFSFRKYIFLISAAALTASAAAQSTIDFCNDCLPSPPDRLVYDANGNPLVGTNYVAQLYFGVSPDSLSAPATAPARFRDVGTPKPGTWIPKSIALITPPVETLYLQVRVWDAEAAATYNEAIENMTGAQHGRSEVFIYNPCDEPPSPNCEKMLNFRGFRLGTNPPPNTLVIRENGALVDLLFKGTHTIQATANLRTGPWVNLGTHTAPFTDPSSGTIKDRFYRINDAGVFSQNAVGYYRVDLCAGYSLIANQFDAYGGNTISNVIKEPPNGAQVFKFKHDTGGYSFMQFVDHVWEGNRLDLTLQPGEGIFFAASVPYSQRFLGEVRALSSVPIVPGFSIISSPLPVSGPVNLLPPDGIGLPVQNGDQVYQWDCVNNRYIFNQFVDGVWEGAGGGGAPFINLGEAFFFSNTGSARTWNRSFTVGP